MTSVYHGRKGEKLIIIPSCKIKLFHSSNSDQANYKIKGTAYTIYEAW